MIGIIDCNIGNVKSLYYFYLENNIECKIINSKNQLSSKINKLILTGVSSFDQMMTSLNRFDFVNLIKNFVTDPNNKLLGICCGMQVLGKSSEEGMMQGLQLIDGEVLILKNKIKPHLGWNKINIDDYDLDITKGLSSNDYLYFLHSYYFNNLDRNAKCLFTNYDDFNFISCINKKNIYGVQFHPEKSHDAGKKILINFNYL